MQLLHHPRTHDIRLAVLALPGIPDALASGGEIITDMFVVIDMVSGEGSNSFEPGAHCR